MNVLWNRKRNVNPVFRRTDRSFGGKIFSKIKIILTKSAVVGIVAGILLLLGIGLLIKYMSSDNFKISEINYYGAKLTEQSQLEGVKSDFLGKNIFLLSTKQVENSILEKGSYIEQVYVEKSLPSKLEIHIIEKDPKFIYLNFTNAYLIDKDNKVIDILSQNQEFNLGEEESKILRGFGSPDSKVVIQRILADKEGVTDENKQATIDAITPEEKSRAISTIKSEVNSFIESDFAKHIDAVSKSRFWHLPVVFNYESKEYKVKDEIEHEKSEMFVSLAHFFENEPQFQVTRYLWEGEFKLSVTLNTGQTFYFSPKRELKLQEQDLILITNELKQQDKTFKSIDFSAEKVVVEK